MFCKFFDKTFFKSFKWGYPDLNFPLPKLLAIPGSRGILLFQKTQTSKHSQVSP